MMFLSLMLACAERRPHPEPCDCAGCRDYDAPRERQIAALAASPDRLTVGADPARPGSGRTVYAVVDRAGRVIGMADAAACPIPDRTLRRRARKLAQAQQIAGG